MKEENPYTDCTLRVRYAETDQMGVAYHANYLIWFEVGRADFCRQHGFLSGDGIDQQAFLAGGGGPLSLPGTSRV